MLHGSTRVLKDQALSQDILKATSQGQKVYMIDTEHQVGVLYEPSKDGKTIEISADPTTRPLSGRPVLSIDPASTKGYVINTTTPADHVNLDWQKNWWISYSRGHGKTYALEQWKASLESLDTAMKGASEGLQKLAEVNEELSRKKYEAECAAEEAVTDERVKVFAETYFLPYDYAKEVLLQAYIDSELSKEDNDDSTE